MGRIALGTVQFGLDYGINNSRGQVSKDEVFSILDLAREAGLDMLDTAYGYGSSERVLGEYIRKKKADFKLISKLPKGSASETREFAYDSLKTLGIATFYGYLVHDLPSFLADPFIWQHLQALKRAQKTVKIGFSLYYPEELDLLLEKNIDFDLVQVPYSIFDRRFESKFPLLKDRGVEIHVRSVFLQGLLFKNSADLSEKFAQIKDKILQLALLAREAAVSRASLCLNFALLNQEIDRVLVGVDSRENFQEIVDSLNDYSKVDKIRSQLLPLREDDLGILLPFNWS